jgi:hypothetical protein
MRKIILVLAFTFPMMILNAQGVRFSFMANPQLTWFSGTDEDYQANGTFPAINIGVELDAFFTENYAFSTGISINNIRGGAVYNDTLLYDMEDEVKVLPADSRMTYNIQYINIPLGLKFKTIEIGYTTYWINTGLTPMFRIKANTTDESGNFDDTEFKDEIRLFNMNYFIEGGVEYSLGGNTAIVGGIGYYSGFFDITENSSFRLTSSAFAITLGIQF